MELGGFQTMISQTPNLLCQLELISWETGKGEDLIALTLRGGYQMMEKCQDIFSLNPI